MNAANVHETCLPTAYYLRCSHIRVRMKMHRHRPRIRRLKTFIDWRVTNIRVCCRKKVYGYTCYKCYTDYSCSEGFTETIVTPRRLRLLWFGIFDNCTGFTVLGRKITPRLTAIHLLDEIRRENYFSKVVKEHTPKSNDHPWWSNLMDNNKNHMYTSYIQILLRNIMYRLRLRRLCLCPMGLNTKFSITFSFNFWNNKNLLDN